MSKKLYDHITSTNYANISKKIKTFTKKKGAHKVPAKQYMDIKV